MISVAIVGKGNVAFHLYHELNKCEDLQVVQFDSRKQQSLENFDLAMIAVSDDAIAEVSRPIRSSLVIHTSGSTNMEVLQNSTRKGVFYPLQSFSKEKPIDFTKIPLCLEATNDADFGLLESLAEKLQSPSYRISSEQRQYMHIAAVFVNNFTNHMYQNAWNLFQEHDIPFNILMPLIQETTEKIARLNPAEAQTGPAIRNDQETIKKHVNLLPESQRELYKTITESIQKHGKKL
jgi:predicted short-subunit dehydrogenase-like oxidoreductase (DUF2520 family)